MLSMLLGQQGGNTKYLCFLSLWDSRAKQDHWIKRKWPSREVFVLREKNIKNVPLVNRKKVLLPPLHIKLWLMKQFVKALDKEGECFKYLCTKFPRLTYEKNQSRYFRWSLNTTIAERSGVYFHHEERRVKCMESIL